jgi:CHAD domain-containing protein
MTPMPLLYLNDEDRNHLLDLAQTGPELLSHRARLILAYADGKPTLQASKEAGISRGRARFWKREFIVKGMGIFEVESSTNAEPEEINGSVIKITEVLDEEKQTSDQQLLEEILTVELPFPQPREKIGIEITDTLAEAGRKVWLYYFAEMLNHEQGTLRGENIEELHDMRVATRRMRTAFDIFSPAFDEKILRSHLKGLRKIGRVLGWVRDMDVILENAENYQAKMKEQQRPGMQPLLTDWSATIDHQRVKMIKHLQSEDYRDFKVNFNLFLQPNDPKIKEGVHTEGTNPFIRDSIPALVYSRYAAVRAYESILPTASIPQLHALRIEFKKFRYTLEYFKEVLGEEIIKAINEIKRMQDHLGELHDADVACLLVRNFLKEWEKNQISLPIPERENPEPIVSYLAFLYAERYRLVRTFPEYWRKFNHPQFRQIIGQAVSRL